MKARRFAPPVLQWIARIINIFIMKDFFNRPFFKDNKRAIAWMCVIIFLLILVVAFLNSQDKAVAPPPTPVPPTVNVAELQDKKGCCEQCKKCHHDSDILARGFYCQACAACQATGGYVCESDEFNTPHLKLTTSDNDSPSFEFKWPGCNVKGLCPPPLQEQQVFKQVEINSLVGQHPGLCTCALLCPEKCETETNN